MEQDRKVAVVTGASSGIGRAAALEFAKAGYDVVLGARRQDELESTAAECEAHEVRALAIETDTTDDDAVNYLRDMAVDTFGHIDIWVNNAAVYLAGKFEDIPLKDMHRIMDTNFFGYVYGSRAALTQFRTQGHGRLINVASVNSVAPQPYVSIYSASKAAVRAFDESLRMELRLDGLDDKITVSTVMPAGIDTNLFQNGANYTGKKLQAVEPVYDPELVATAIVGLAAHPKREVIVGGAGKFMALQNALMPKSYEKQVGTFTHKNLLTADSALATSGNLYEPIEGNRGTRGGWQEQRVSGSQVSTGVGIGLGVAVVGIAAGVGYLLTRRSKRMLRILS